MQTQYSTEKTQMELNEMFSWTIAVAKYVYVCIYVMHV